MALRRSFLSGLFHGRRCGVAAVDRRSSCARLPGGLSALLWALAGAHSGSGAWGVGHQPDLLRAPPDFYLPALLPVLPCAHAIFPEGFLQVPNPLAHLERSLGQSAW